MSTVNADGEKSGGGEPQIRPDGQVIGRVCLGRLGVRVTESRDKVIGPALGLMREGLTDKDMVMSTILQV